MTTQNQINATGPLTDGELYIGSSAGVASAATITAGSGVTVANGHNSITISTVGGGLTWSTVTAGTSSPAINTGTIANHSATPLVLTLPATAAEGSTIAVCGLSGSGGWTLTANTGQTIQFGTQSSSSAGSWSSTNATDCAFVVCAVANTTWIMYSGLSAGLTVV